MDLTGEQLLPLSRERVWDAMFDPETLRASIPGCESVTDLGGGAYAVSVVAAVGPVKARFKGTLRQENPQRPQKFVMAFEGEGGVAGFAKGSAEVTLDEEGAEQTRLRYVAQAQIGGRLAAIGSRLIDASAARMSSQFFAKFTEVLTAPAGEPAVAATVPAGTARPASAPMAAAPVAAPAPAPGVVVVQMPAWTWSLTVIVLAALAAYLGTH